MELRNQPEAEMEDIDLPEAGEDEEIQALLDTLSDFEEEIEELRAELEAVKSEASSRAAHAASLQKALDECIKERDELALRAAQYAEAEKRAIAERIFDIRVRLGRAGAEEREEAVAAYVKRTIDSLKDTLNDLLAEMPAVDVPVAPPASGVLAVSGEANAPVDGVSVGSGGKLLSLEQGLSRLLRGSRR